MSNRNPKMLKVLAKVLNIVAEQLEREAKRGPRLSPKLRKLIAASLQHEVDYRAGKVKPGYVPPSPLKCVFLD